MHRFETRCRKEKSWWKWGSWGSRLASAWTDGHFWWGFLIESLKTPRMSRWPTQNCSMGRSCAKWACFGEESVQDINIYEKYKSICDFDPFDEIYLQVWGQCTACIIHHIHLLLLLMYWGHPYLAVSGLGQLPISNELAVCRIWLSLSPEMTITMTKFVKTLMSSC